MVYLKSFFAELARILMTLRSPMISANNAYKGIYHKDINWNNPQNLIEKIYWLELFSDTTLWTMCADKFRIREFIHNKGLDHVLPKLYGHWYNSKEIDYNMLPNSFVLKTTNGCGQVLIVKDKTKLDIQQTTTLLNKWMKLKYGYIDGQIHYSRIKPSIIAEEFLHDNSDLNNDTALIDYKLWCINGEPIFFLIITDRVILGPNRGYSLCAYDLQWNNITTKILNEKKCHLSKRHIDKPQCLEEMIEIAKVVSSNFQEVRVDFYQVNGKVYLGEMTFTTAYGYFTDDLYRYLGSKIDLNKVKRIKGINRPPLF